MEGRDNIPIERQYSTSMWRSYAVPSVTDRFVPQWQAAARSWERQPFLVIRTNIRRLTAHTASTNTTTASTPPPVVTLSARGFLGSWEDRKGGGIQQGSWNSDLVGAQPSLSLFSSETPLANTVTEREEERDWTLISVHRERKKNVKDRMDGSLFGML